MNRDEVNEAIQYVTSHFLEEAPAEIGHLAEQRCDNLGVEF